MNIEYAKTGNPYNILSGGMALKLLDATKTNDFATITTGGVNAMYVFGLRHCTVKGERSGGMVVWVRINKTYEHGSYYNASTFSRRLPENASFKRVAKALGRGWLEAQDAQQHRPARESLYLKVESKAMKEHELDTITETGESIGHTSVYENMSTKDCAYWTKALAI